jgi:hypothetical protein
MLVTTDGNYPSTDGWETLPGEAVTVAALGTYDGATVKFQAYIDAAWRDIPEASGTSDFAQVIDMPAASALRADVASAGESTSVSITMTKVVKS